MTPAQLLEKNGFIPKISEPYHDDFVRACKEGLDDVVTAYLDLGMSPNARQSISRESALIKAAEGGFTSTMEILLARGADLELRDSSDDTALRTALNWKHPEAARFLAKKGANVDAPSKYGISTLEHAIEEHEENVDLLLELGANPAFVSQGRSPMRQAIDGQKLEILKKLLDRGAPASLVLDQETGVTALHHAVNASSDDAVDLLLQRGAVVEARDAHGLTPTDYALFLGRRGVVDKLGADVTPQQRARAQFWTMLSSENYDEALDHMEQEDVNVDARNHEHKTALSLCAEKGAPIEIVKRLLHKGARPTNEALSAAVAAGHAEIVRALLDAKAPIFNAKKELPGFGSAAWEGHVDVVRLILDACTLEERARFSQFVKYGVMQKNVEMVKLLAEKGVPLNHRDEIGGETPLIGAVTSYHSHEIVRVLLDAGADIHVTDDNKCTALHKICHHYNWDEDYEPTLKLLVERGARWDTIDWLGSTPCDTTQKAQREFIATLELEHNWATLQILLDAGKDIVPLLDRGVSFDPPKGAAVDSLLTKAVEKQDANLVRELVRRGADVNRASHWGSTALMSAVSKGSKEIIDILLDAGADIHASWPNGVRVSHSAIEHPELLPYLHAKGLRFDETTQSALLLACHRPNVEAVEFLIAHGALLDVMGVYGDTPLTTAIEGGHDAIALLLIEAGASPTLMSRKTGETPLTAAAKRGSGDIVRALLAKGAKLADKNKEGEDTIAIIARRKALRQEFAGVLAAHGIDVSVPKLEPLDASLARCSDVWRAVYTAKEERVISAIEGKELDVNARDPWGVTPLMAATLHRKEAFIARLIEAGANPDLEDNNKARAYDYTLFDRVPEIDALLKTQNSMDRLNAQAARSLVATELNDVLQRGEIVKLANLLREKKVHPFLGISGRPLFLEVMSTDDEDLLGAILELGLSPDVSDAWGNTPLLQALSSDNTELAQKLVDAGARVSAAGLLVGAIQSGNTTAVTWLLEHGADKTGAMKAAIVAGNMELIEQLPLEDGALHVAIENWYASSEPGEVARYLIECGVDVNKPDDARVTPLYKAIELYQEEAARLLLDKGATWDDASRELAKDRGMEL